MVERRGGKHRVSLALAVDEARGDVPPDVVRQLEADDEDALVGFVCSAGRDVSERERAREVVEGADSPLAERMLAVVAVEGTVLVGVVVGRVVLAVWWREREKEIRTGSREVGRGEDVSRRREGQRVGLDAPC